MTRRRAIISGASSGIGLATARRFALAGWDVCVTALHEPELAAAHQGLADGQHLLVAGDYSKPPLAAELARVIDRDWAGRVDALVNCAGLSLVQPAIESDLSQWRRCLDVMLDGAVHLTRMAVPRMARGGRIIHISSIQARRAEPGGSSYAMAKAAIEQYVRNLAMELADRGILANAIAPGFIDTPMSRATGINELETDAFRQSYVQGHHLPLRRAGRPEEVAGVALFLAGPDATYITGQTLVVDGGLTITF